MKKIAIYNNKGGVAKTTSVINIAYALNKADKKTLVVDCDMQKNCYLFFLSEKSDYILPTKYKNIMHTTYDVFEKLSDSEISEYDFILFDLPPVLDDYVINIIQSADSVYVPLMLRRFELQGLTNLTSVCGNKLAGIFVTMYRSKDSDVLAEFRKALGTRMMQTVIPFSETVIDSQKSGLPLEEYFEKRNVPRFLKNAWKVVDAYEKLAKEIMRR